MKVVIFLSLLLLTLGKYVRENHNYWYTAAKKTATYNTPYVDFAWNYCDMKCLYLEKYNTGADFVVVSFTQSSFKPDFAACYVKSATGGYTLWNKVTSNSFFDQNCGGDSEDYIKNTDKYTVTKKEGQGVGNEIKY